jgi:ribose/xylose/arabinose/galactoside ABC-type transport system permease subunit
MNVFASEDRLEWLGILVGLFVLVVGFGSLLEPPFATNANTTAALVQTVGILATIVVGVLMILVSYTGDTRALLPFGGSSEVESGTDESQ